MQQIIDVTPCIGVTTMYIVMPQIPASTTEYLAQNNTCPNDPELPEKLQMIMQARQTKRCSKY